MTIQELQDLLAESITVYDVETDEYYPVQSIEIANTSQDVLDPGNIVLQIKG